MADDGKWVWWVGGDEERYTDECDTREEAVRIAIEDYEGAYIIEAQKPEPLKMSDFIGANDLTERASDAAYDEHADPDGDPIFEVTPEQEASLRDAVKYAVDMWQAGHGLVFVSFKFSAQRNGEYIEAPDTETSED